MKTQFVEEDLLERWGAMSRVWHCGKADSILREQFVRTEHDLICEIELH